jgi:hypothetical protein
MDQLETARRDPRAIFRWREMEQREFAEREAQRLPLVNFFRFRRPPPGRFPIRSSADIHTDWNISLGNGATGPGQFPAKYAFDPTTTVTAANCTSDFIVFPVNVAGSGTQPNIVAFNNLYSGGAGATLGICDSRVTTGHVDTKTSPTVYWSYNVHALTNGAVPTSPVLSLDGTKVAFVESVAGSAAHFHVLAWNATDGQNNNLQSLASTKAIVAFSATTPAAGAATDLALGAATTGTDTLSSPYIDYSADTAYVGNDAGVLFRIKNVFCPAGGCAAPSLDTTWGGTGSVTVCAGKLTGPVQDYATLRIFVGCADGKVYGFSSTGTALATPSIAIGNGSAATGGVVESPIVDGMGFLYAVSGTGAVPNTGSAVLVQAKVDLTSVRVATVGAPGLFNLHAPAFNDAYFSSATSTNWLLYVAAYSADSTNIAFWGATFDASRNMTTGTPGNTKNFGTRLGEFAPLTEFKNGATDWLFHGLLIAPSDMGENNINAFPTTNPALATIPAGCTGGITGIIVDNASAANQASSIYFSCVGGNLAFKFTQAGLN